VCVRHFIEKNTTLVMFWKVDNCKHPFSSVVYYSGESEEVKRGGGEKVTVL